MNKKIICTIIFVLLGAYSNSINNDTKDKKILKDNISFEDEEIISPTAKSIPEKINYNFEIYTDNYSWMKDKSNPDLINYLAQENKYSDSILEKNIDIKQQLFGEMSEKISLEEETRPEKNGNYYYYQKYLEGQQYPLYYRKNINNIYSSDELILDLNKFSQGKNISFPGDFKVSPDNKYLAFSIDNDGNETYTIYIMNLQTNEFITEEINNTYGNIEWTNDSKYIYYSVLNNSLRPFKIYKHKINSSLNSDLLIYHERDNAYSVNISKTDSKAYILINSESINSNEIRYLGAKNLNSRFQIFQKRASNIKYYIQHNGGKFYILTNSNARHFKIMSVNVLEQYRKVSWEQVIPTNYNLTLNSFQMLKNNLVIYFREKGLSKIKVFNIKNNKKYDIDFPEPSYSIKPISVNDFNSDKLHFSYSSFLTPTTIYEYDLAKRTRKLIKEEKIKSFNSYNYQSERLNITSRDGKKIPVSLIYKKDMVRNGENNLFLTAYGAYGESNDPKFEIDKLSLVDRGFIYAIAHVRGGGEFGTDWYESGKLLDKKNTFNDFIDCAESLIYQGYTSKEKITAFGKGAGGMLVATSINLRPELFKNVLLEDPFLDVLNTMKDETLPLTIDEYNEWGNPNRYRYYEYIKSYSPYDNIINQKYPNILITSGINNSVVGVWESAKYTAKIRNLTKKTNILLKTYTDSGHKGKIGKFDYFKRKSLEYSYILNP